MHVNDGSSFKGNKKVLTSEGIMFGTLGLQKKYLKFEILENINSSSKLFTLQG